jgi:hypothetical protein
MFRFDGIVIAALILSAVLTAWLGISGPITAPIWKDWQPLMAACVALIGATLVYLGAMAKVAFDREVHQTAERQKRVGVYLRLLFPIQFVEARAMRIRDKARARPGFAQKTTVSKSDLAPSEPEALIDAWNKLELFPAHIARQLAVILRSTRSIIEVLDKYEDDAALERNWPQDDDSVELSLIAEEAATIQRAATAVAGWLETAIGETD